MLKHKKMLHSAKQWQGIPCLLWTAVRKVQMWATNNL